MASRFQQTFDNDITGSIASVVRNSAEAMRIDKPAPGSVQIADVQRALAIKFGFDLADVKITAVDVDLVLIFPDGGRLVLPGLALSLLSAEPPQIAFNEEVIEPMAFISRLGDVQLMNQVPALSLASVEAEKSAEAQGQGQGQGHGTSDKAPVPSGVGTTQTQHEGVSGLHFPEAVTVRPLPDSARPLARMVPDASPGKSSSGQYDEPPGDLVNKAQISARLFGVTEVPPLTPEGDSWISSNAFAAVPADRDPSLGAQTRATRLVGTDRDDILNAADFARVGSGQSIRRVELSAIAIGQDNEIASKIRVILPAGFRIENVVPQGSYYEFETNGQNTIAFNLIYDLPAADAALGANGYFGTIKTMVVEMLIGDAIYAGRQAFVIAPRVGEGALEMQIDSKTKAAVLWSNPPDAVIDAGAGDDTIHASASADLIDGGAGYDLVSYSQSHIGVVASLITGGSKGYAAGDTYTNIEGLSGSAFADHLIGNALDNVLIGRRGADTLDGGAGRDLADYAGSTAAVTINLKNETQFGGDAHGDVLISIEDVRGSAFRDELVGNAFANRLWGEAGNDLIRGDAGDDTLDGGLGTDTLDYSDLTETDSVSVAIHHESATQATILRQGLNESDSVTGFENVTGGRGNDTLIGSTRANLLIGGTGDDWLQGRGGTDTLNGGEGNDTASFIHLLSNQSLTITLSSVGDGLAEIRDEFNQLIEANTLVGFENVEGGAGADSITGNDIANQLAGGLGADLLIGAGGHDTLDGGLGIDTLIGGFGDDLYLISESNDVVVEQIDEGQDSARLTANFLGTAYTLTNHVEILDASLVQQGLTLTGNALANSILGGAGADTLDGGAGVDTLRGGAGDDVYLIQDLEDTIDETSTGSAGHDTIRLVSNSLAAYSLTNIGGVENLDASTLTASLALTGNALANSILGGAGADTLDGGAGADTMRGGAGDDLYLIGESDDTISEQANEGQDSARLTANFVGAAYTLTNHVETLDASLVQQGLTLNGSGQANSILGGAGADTLDGGAGVDTLSGGAGDDVYLIQDLDDVIDETSAGAGGNDTIRLVNNSLAAYSLATLGGVENLDASTLTASLALTGNTLANSILGGTGADTLDGGLGIDTLIGGLGDDLYLINESDDGIVEQANEGQDSARLTANFVGATYTLANHVEILDASLVQQGLTLNGNAQANLLMGGAGADTLDGGADVDTLRGGAGDDVYLIQDQDDIIDETSTGAGGNDTIRLVSNSLAAYSLANIGGVENLDASTLTASLALTGNALANSILGGAGADTLDGGAGADTLRGGAGNDVYLVDAINDLVDETSVGSSGTDTIRLIGSSLSSYTITVSGATGVEYLDASALSQNLTLNGNSLSNSLIGGSGHDLITDDNGNDTINGGLGNDTLNAGGGFDRYQFDWSMANGAGWGQDVIFHFEPGSDKLETRNLGFNPVAADFTELFDVTPFVSGPVSVTLRGVLALGDLQTITLNYRVGGPVYGNTVFSDFVFVKDPNVTWITGNSSSNTLSGTNGNDTILGLAGDDSIHASLGQDILDGGSGVDIVNYAGFTSSVSINLGLSGAQTIADGISQTLISIEGLMGTAFADSLVGSANDDVISGGAGNDTLDGGAGSDTLDYSYLTTNLTLSLAASGVQQTIVASLGSDEDVVRNFENVIGGAGHDNLTGHSGANILMGGAGNDTLDGGAGADTLRGGAGDDVYYVDNINDVIDETSAGSSGTDLVITSVNYTLGTNVENVQVSGSVGLSVTGNELGNWMRGGSGNDTLNGGGGRDILDYSLYTSSLLFSAMDGSGRQTVTAVAGSDVDVIQNIENILAGSGHDSIIGNNANNSIVGGDGDDWIRDEAGNDTLLGGAGNDTISGGIGNDSLDGGDGVDTLDYSYLTGGVTVVLAGGGAQQTINAVAGSDVDIIRNFENVTGGSGNDYFVGDWNNNTIIGGAGDDTISGSTTGVDRLIGGVGNDTLLFHGFTSGVTFTLAQFNAGMNGSAAQTYSATNLFLSIEGFENIAGWTGNDWLIGNDANNIISGDAGNDTLDGGAGADTLRGGAGDDVYYVDNINDVIDETSAGSSGTDLVFTSVNYTLSANVENAQVNTTGSRSIIGNSIANNIVGGTGNDTISGGMGNDTLDGGSGNDTLDYSYLTTGLSLAFNSGGAQQTVTAVAGSDVDVIQNFENIIGGSGNDSLLGNSGNNTINGGAGDDTIAAGTHGADSLIGGIGNDTLRFVYGFGINFTLANIAVGANGSGWQSFSAPSVNHVSSGFENLLGTNFNDTLTGNDGDNVISGANGNDTLSGGVGGIDTLFGGLGDDRLILDVTQLTSFADGGTGSDSFQFAARATPTATSLTLNQLDLLLDNTETIDFTGANNQISLAALNLASGSADRTALSGIGGGAAITIRYDVTASTSHTDQIGGVTGAAASDATGTAGAVGYTQNFYADAAKTQLLLTLIAA